MQTANLYDYELYLFHQGTNCRAYQLLGGFFLWNATGKSEYVCRI